MKELKTFGILNVISGIGLSENLNINPKEATKFINEYYETYPGIKKYQDECIKNAHEVGFVKTVFNRIRTIDELNNKPSLTLVEQEELEKLERQVILLERQKKILFN